VKRTGQTDGQISQKCHVFVGEVYSTRYRRIHFTIKKRGCKVGWGSVCSWFDV